MAENLFNKDFWKAALARALHTMAQTALGVIGATAFIEKVNWIAVASAAALATIVSLLKSIVIGVPEAEIEHPTITFLNTTEDGEDGEDDEDR